MKRPFLILSLGIFLAACGNGDVDNTQPATDRNGTAQETVLARSCDDLIPDLTIAITSEGFSPSETVVPVNGVVRWVNADADVHSVVSGEYGHAGAGVLFFSGALPPGEDFCVQFFNWRDVHYFCEQHVEEQGEIHVGFVDDDRDGDRDRDREHDGPGDDDHRGPR